ncbi:MAG: nucleotide pyrophosphohydrolase [Anaerolineales bacterium]
MDDTTTVADLKRAIADFVAERDWSRNHDLKSLAVSVAIETAELLEHFQWLDRDESRNLMADEGHRAEVAAEVADVLIYLLQFANAADIDLSEAFRTKMARNALRFPVGLPWGSGDQTKLAR